MFSFICHQYQNSRPVYESAASQHLHQPPERKRTEKQQQQLPEVLSPRTPLHTYTQTCKHPHTCRRTHSHKHAHPLSLRSFTHTHTQTCKHPHTCRRAHSHKHTHPLSLRSFTHTHTQTCTHPHTCRRAHSHKHTHPLSLRSFTHTHTHTHIHKHVNIHTHAGAHTHTSTHTHFHSDHSHTHTHTRTHTHINFFTYLHSFLIFLILLVSSKLVSPLTFIYFLSSLSRSPCLSPTILSVFPSLNLPLFLTSFPPALPLPLSFSLSQGGKVTCRTSHWDLWGLLSLPLLRLSPWLPVSLSEILCSTEPENLNYARSIGPRACRSNNASMLTPFNKCNSISDPFAYSWYIIHYHENNTVLFSLTAVIVKPLLHTKHMLCTSLSLYFI